MKNLISILLLSISAIILTSCGNNPSSYGTSATEENTNNNVTANEPTPAKEETLCFFNKGNGVKGEEGIPDTHIQLTIQGDSVKAISDDYQQMTGIDVTFSGIRKGDTLFLLCICPDGPVGDEVYNDERIYLLQSDKLLQLETINKNGKTILKNSSKPKIILTYNEINCK